MAALEEKQRANIASEDAEYVGPPIPFVRELSDCPKRVSFHEQCIEKAREVYTKEGIYAPGDFVVIAAADGSTVGKLGGSQVILSMVAIAKGEFGREDACFRHAAHRLRCDLCASSPSTSPSFTSRAAS